MVYSEVFFSSTEKIASELRKDIVASVASGCIKRQRTLNQNQTVTENRITEFCLCAGNRVADHMTYKDAGERSFDALKQKIELAGNACRP